MGKAITFLAVMTGIMLVFYLGGLLTECTGDLFCKSGTASSTLLDLAFSPENAENSTLGVGLAVVLALGVIGGITIGLFSRNVEIIIISPFVALLVAIGYDFIFVITRLYSINPIAGILIGAPLAITYILTIVEFWRGRD